MNVDGRRATVVFAEPVIVSSRRSRRWRVLWGRGAPHELL